MSSKIFKACICGFKSNIYIEIKKTSWKMMNSILWNTKKMDPSSPLKGRSNTLNSCLKQCSVGATSPSVEKKKRQTLKY